MSNHAVALLLERLLWPVPRIRWEVGRSLAELVREENREASDGLLNWISRRKLESEVILGLGIIDAFDLGGYFDLSAVSGAVRAPSHLSDWILNRNFATRRAFSPFRYAVSSLEPPKLPLHVESWFDRYREWAVPPLFSDRLERLGELAHRSFLERWRHEWRWLQATDGRPSAAYPYFFSIGDRHRRGQFDHGQRELYVSAYLRTLAFAAHSGAIRHHQATQYAMAALTMNRGLADLQPIVRPEWTQGLLPCEDRRFKEMASEIWEGAQDTIGDEEVPLRVRVADHDARGFVEFKIALVIGPTGFTLEPPEARELIPIVTKERPGEFAGLVGGKASGGGVPDTLPLALTQQVTPDNIGRVHVDAAVNIRLASPYVFGAPGRIRCGPSEIRLDAGRSMLSRWIHWYADWRPAIFPELETVIGSVTTVSRESLERLCAPPNVEVARLVRVRRAVRPQTYSTPEVEAQAFWA